MAYVKRRAPRKNTRRPRKNRKNVKRKALAPYRAGAKKAMARKINPIAEGRRLTFTNTTSARFLGPDASVENWYVHVPDTWDHMYRENFLDTLPNQPSSMGFTGKTLFSRFLNQQIKIKFDTINHYTQPVDVHVCYGWCKVPYVTPLQATGSDSQSNENGVLIAHQRSQQIARNLAKMYNVMFPVNDPKMFKLMYNREFQIRGQTLEGVDLSDPSAPKATIQTIRKDLDFNISWKPNTKYHMRSATAGDGSDGSPPPGNSLKPDDGSSTYMTAPPANTTAYWTPSSKLNGDLWTPFFAFQVKNAVTYGRAPDGNPSIQSYPYLFQQNKHYFYDM